LHHHISALHHTICIISEVRIEQECKYLMQS
jgi:hypothetical protein